MQRRTRTAILSAVLFAASPAFAQQPSPSQMAIQINVIVGQWSQALELQQQQIKDLQARLDQVTKERDELRAKVKASD